MVKTEWRRHSPRSQLTTRLKRVRIRISEWKHQNPTNTATEIKALKHQLENAFNQQSPSLSTIKDIKRKLSNAYYLEEVYGKQKSRNQWLLEGDRNTKFFHGCAKTRKAQNRMIKVQDYNGMDHIGEENILMVATDYFQQLFQSNDSEEWGDFFDNITSPVSNEMNQMLTTPVSVEEIRQAAMSMN